MDHSLGDKTTLIQPSKVLKNAYKKYLRLLSITDKINVKKCIDQGCKLGDFLPSELSKKDCSVLRIRLRSFSSALQVEDFEGNSILHLMAKTGKHGSEDDVDIAEAYCTTGGSVDVLNDAGQTPLYYACATGHSKIFKFLLDRGANVNLTRSEEMERPIHAAARLRGARRFQKLVINKLFSHGGYIDAVTARHKTAIAVACNMSHGINNENIISELLRHGCDLNCVDEEGRTPLHYLCKHKRWTLVGDFLQRGANPNIVDKEGIAAISGVAELLQSTGLENYLVITYIVTCLQRLDEFGAPLRLADRELYARLKTFYDNYPQRSFISITLVDRLCRAELDYMEKVWIDRHTTLKDILYKNAKDLVDYVYNRRLQFILRDSDFASDYRNYGSILKYKFLLAKHRNLVLKRARKFLRKLVKFDGQTESFNAFLSFFPNSDIIDMIDFKSGNGRRFIS